MKVTAMAGTACSGRGAHAEKLIDIGAHITRVAHELAGPLSLIVGSLDALDRHAATLLEYAEATVADAGADAHVARLREQGQLDYAMQSIRELLDICREGTRRLDHVIRQLRSHGRHLGGATDPSPVSVPDVLSSAVRMVTATRPQPVETDIAPLPPLSGSAGLLGEVFANLIANACDAVAGQAGGRVRVIARTIREPRPQVVVRVCDNGPGVAPEHHERIFEPFFTTKAGGAGLGLGLVIAREIIEAHGGTLALVPGEGGEFVATLPVSLGPL